MRNARKVMESKKEFKTEIEKRFSAEQAEIIWKRSHARLAKIYQQYPDLPKGVVVGTRHAHSIREHVPEWWGIITVEDDEGGLDFYYYRFPEKNQKVDMKRKISILWRPELAHIQELNGMPKYREKSKLYVADKIIETVPAETLSPQISEELFQRDYTTIEETLNEFRKERIVRKWRRRR